MARLQGIRNKLKGITAFRIAWNTLCILFRDIQTDPISMFVPAEKLADTAYMQRLKADIKRSRRLCGVTTAEYFLFGFPNLGKRERKTFMGLYDVVGRIEERYNNTSCRELFYNKYATYSRFKVYYGRDVLRITDVSEGGQYEAFCEKHSRFVVKPIASEQGKGVYVVKDAGQRPSIKKLLESGPCVLEAFVCQAPELASFHPDSVNTVRVLTVCRHGKVTVLYAFLRVGCGGSVVDNANAGGITAAIDRISGRIMTDGYRENGRVFQAHPDTGVVFKGFQIPRWNELIEIAQKLPLVEQRVSIMGWDMALTENGWVMIEGNDRPAFTAIQMCRQRGLRPDFEKAMGI